MITSYEMDFSDVTMDDIQTDPDNSMDSWGDTKSSVSWQSSQTNNPALNRLMTETVLAPRSQIASSSRAWQKSASLEIIPGYSSPLQGSLNGSLNSLSNISSSGRKSTSRSQLRPRNPGDRILSRTSSEQAIPILSKAVPPQFMDLVKGVSETLNESAGIPTRNISGPSITRVARNRNNDRRPSERRGAAVLNGSLRKPTFGRVFSTDSRLPSAAVKGKSRAVEVGNSMEGVEIMVGSGPSYTGQRGEYMMDDNDIMIGMDKDQKAHGAATSSEGITTFPRTFSQAQMPPPMGLPSKHPPTDQASRNHDMSVSGIQPVLPPTHYQPMQSDSFKPEDKLMRRDPVPKLHPLLQKQASLTTQGTSSTNSVSYLDKRASNVNLSRGVVVARSPANHAPPLPSTATLSSTPSFHPPVLGMRRTHTVPLRGSAAANQKGGLSTRQKGFKPPLLSNSQPSQTQTIPKDNLHEKRVTISSPGMSSASSNSSSLSGQTQSSYSSSSTVSTPSGSSTFPSPAMVDSKSEMHSKIIPQVDSVVHPIPQTPPLPEPTDGDPDSSFGNMSFDLDALEETMKMYD